MTDEEFEELFGEVCEAFGNALFTTIHEATKPSIRAAKGRPKVYNRWRKFGAKFTEFVKETER